MKYLSNLFLFIDDFEDTKSYKIWSSDNEVITSLAKLKNTSKTSIVHDLLLMAQKNNLYLQELKQYKDTEEFKKLVEIFKKNIENNMQCDNNEDRYFLQEEFTRKYKQTLETTIKSLELSSTWNATSLIFMFPEIFSVHYNETIKPLLKDSPVFIEKIEWRFILATLWHLFPEKYYLFEIPMNKEIKNYLEEALKKQDQLWFHFITFIVNAFDSEKNYFISIYNERLPEDFFPIDMLQEFIKEKSDGHETILKELGTVVDQIIDDVRNKNFK